MNNKRITFLIWTLLTLLAVVVGLYLQKEIVYSHRHENLTKQAQQTSSDIYEFSNNGAVMGASVLAGITSDNVKKRILGLLPPDDASLQNDFAGILEQYNANSVFIVDKKGQIVAARNRNSALNSLGISVKFRPYWLQGSLGIPNVYPAISTLDHQRGLFFAAPVYQTSSNQSSVIGVFVIMINASILDKKFLAYSSPIALISPDGLIFSSNLNEWRLKLSEPISHYQQQKLIHSRQFADLFDKQIPTSLSAPLLGSYFMLNGNNYAVHSAPVSWPDQFNAWRVVLLQDMSDWLPVWQRVLLAGAIVGMMSVLLWIWLLLLRIKEDAFTVVKAKQETQEKAKKHLKNLSDALPLAIFQITWNANYDHWSYTYASAKCKEILGIDPLEILTNYRILENQVYLDDADYILDLFHLSLEQKSGFTLEYRVLRDGQVVWIKAKAMCTQTAKHEWVWNGYWRDVTNQHLQTQQLHEAKDMAEAATKAKSMFLANMSHEIRTPMNAIIGLTYLALKTELTPKQHDYLTKIHQAGNSLMGIINDILDFSKIEAHQLKLEQINFNLDDVLANLALMSSQRAHEKKLEILFDVPPNIPRSLIGDPLRLGQILINLVSNAVKFTDQGFVHLQIREISRHEPEITLQFIVRDTGIGITQEHISRLFQAFTQADGSTTRRFGGTGLGLTITRHLIEQMDGTIQVESELNVGSQFICTIKLQLNQTNSDTRLFIPHSISGLRILVVDDNPVANDILLTALQQLPVTADAVDNAELAWSTLQQAAASGTPYHLLMTDWIMPEIDGIQLAQRVKTMLPPPHIILVTAFSYDDIQESAKDAGVQGFLTKPFSQSQVVDCLMQQFAPIEGETALDLTQIELPQFKQAKVLLVEDNPINQQIAVELMVVCGIHTDIAANGQEALSLLFSYQPQHYDLVFMDLQMPVMDGHETTLAIRTDKRFAHLPIVAMTAHALQDEKERCLVEGMNAHIAKPIDPAVFYKLLRQYLMHKLSGSNLSPTLMNSHSLPELAGLDSKTALQRINGNQTLYLQLLQQYCREHSDTAKQISSLLSLQQLNAARPLAHSLKGVSANIGANKIAHLAAQLEQALATPQSLSSLQEMADALAIELSQLCLQIDQLNDVTINTKLNNVVPITQDAITTLMKKIADNDCDALDLFAEMESGLQALMPKAELRQINHHLQAFDFDLALARLERFAKQTSMPD